MTLIGYRSTCTTRGPRPPQLKFNNLFNKHFPIAIMFGILCVKNWRGGGELLLKNDTIDGYAY